MWGLVIKYIFNVFEISKLTELRRLRIYVADADQWGRMQSSEEMTMLVLPQLTVLSGEMTVDPLSLLHIT